MDEDQEFDGHSAPHGLAVRGSAVVAVLAALAVLISLAFGPHAALGGRDVASAPVPSVSASSTAAANGPSAIVGPPVLGEQLIPGSAANAAPLREGVTGSTSPWQVGSEQPDLQAVAALLARRSQAVAARNVDAFAATSLDDATARTQAESLAQLPVAEWTSQLDTAHAAEFGGLTDLGASADARREYGDNAYVVRTIVRYRLSGFDRSEVTAAHEVTVVYEGGDWHVVVDEPTDGSRELWDLGPFRIVRGLHSTVLGIGGAGTNGAGVAAPSGATLRNYAEAADIGVRDVTKLWGRQWQQQVLVIAPGTTATMASLLGRTTREYRQIAAVTTAELGGGASISRGDRVFINPEAFAQLGPQGRTIVLRHEITHVATLAAARDNMPTWLEEGFADYIGYRGSGVSDGAIVAELTRYVADGGRPRTLPSDEDYVGTNPHLVEAYEESWLAARMVADTYGSARLVRLYRAVHQDTAASPSDGVDMAFRDVLGVSFDQFTRQWRQRVLALG